MTQFPCEQSASGKYLASKADLPQGAHIGNQIKQSHDHYGFTGVFCDHLAGPRRPANTNLNRPAPPPSWPNSGATRGARLPYRLPIVLAPTSCCYFDRSAKHDTQHFSVFCAAARSTARSDHRQPCHCSDTQASCQGRARSDRAPSSLLRPKQVVTGKDPQHHYDQALDKQETYSKPQSCALSPSQWRYPAFQRGASRG